MKPLYIPPEFEVLRNPDRCTGCRVCVRAVPQRRAPL